MAARSWREAHESIMRDVEEIGEAVLARLREEIPSYGAVPPEVLRAGLMSNVRRALQNAGERRGPSAEELEEAGRIGETRARQGIPGEDVLRGFRSAANEAWAHVRDRARGLGVSDAELLEVFQGISDWVDAAMVRAASSHRRVELEFARRDHHRRANFLRGVLFGSLDAAQVRSRAAAYGLGPEISYRPFRARPDDGVALDRLELTLADASGGEAPLTGLVDGDLVGLLIDRPRGPVAGTVGLGPAVKLTVVEPAFRLAGAALDASIAFGMSGVFELEDLGLRAPVFAQDHLGGRLVARYLEPLEALGAFGRTVEESLGAFFEHGMRVEAAASALFVHPNTLRHRLRRFEEATGADLRRTEELFRVWWALERRRMLRDERSRQGR